MLGIAGVVAVLVAVLSISAGFKSTLETTGSDDAAIVLRAGSSSELSSGLGADDADHQCSKNQQTGDHPETVPADELARAVDGAGRTSGDRLIGEVAFEIGSQLEGRMGLVRFAGDVVFGRGVE